MNDDKDTRAWAREWASPERREEFPPPGGDPAPEAAPNQVTTGERWRQRIAWALFPIPAAFYGLIAALIVGVVDMPAIISEPCSTECLELQAEVRAAYTDQTACTGTGRRLCLVPMGSISHAEIESLTDYYRNRYGITVGVLPGIDVPSTAVHPSDDYVSSVDMIRLLKDEYRAIELDPQVTMIGITTVDIAALNLARMESVFSFHVSGEKLGVVSTARLHPKIIGIKIEGPEGDLRLQKQLNTLVGLMVFNMTLSQESDDAMYSGVTSAFDLDAMPADLPIAPSTRQNRRN